MVGGDEKTIVFLDYWGIKLCESAHTVPRNSIWLADPLTFFEASQLLLRTGVIRLQSVPIMPVNWHWDRASEVSTIRTSPLGEQFAHQWVEALMLNPDPPAGDEEQGNFSYWYFFTCSSTLNGRKREPPAEWKCHLTFIIFNYLGKILWT